MIACSVVVLVVTEHITLVIDQYFDALNNENRYDINIDVFDQVPDGNECWDVVGGREMGGFAWSIIL